MSDVKVRLAAVAVSALLGVVVGGSTAQAANFPADGASLGSIPDGGSCGLGPAPGAPRDVTFPVAGLPVGPPTDVGLNLTFGGPAHTHAGDVVATLIAPGGGPSFTIFGRTGSTTVGAFGDSSNLDGQYIFTDTAPAAPTWWAAATTAAAGLPIPPSAYRASEIGGSPSGGTNTLITPGFAGVGNPNGTWTLRLTDVCGIDNGAVSAAILGVASAVDVTPPAPPALTSTDPVSPANNNTPRIIGTAEAFSTVKLYSTANCTGAELGNGTAAQLAAPGIQINVADNTTTQVYATAADVSNNVSACSAAIGYEERTPPPAPNLTSTNPASPANNNTPRILGTAAPGTTVRLYSSNNCTGTPLATGPAADLTAPGLQITVADNSTTQIRATATQGVNNTSPCSTAISYQEVTPAKDTKAPTTTITKSPKAKTKSKTATFEFTADEAGSTFQCKLEGKKVKPPLTEFAPCTSPQTYKKLKPGKKTFTVHATDAAGNLGADATFSFTVKKKKKK